MIIDFLALLLCAFRNPSANALTATLQSLPLTLCYLLYYPTMTVDSISTITQPFKPAKLAEHVEIKVDKAHLKLPQHAVVLAYQIKEFAPNLELLNC